MDFYYFLAFFPQRARDHPCQYVQFLRQFFSQHFLMHSRKPKAALVQFTTILVPLPIVLRKT